MPRTFVNLVNVLNVAELENLHEGLVCQGVQLYVFFLISKQKPREIFHFSFLCRCAINANTNELTYNLALEYQAATKDFIAKGTYDNKDDFTVVLQSFMEHMSVPTTVI